MTFADPDARLLVDIYAAALNPSLWSETLTRLVGDMRGVASRLILSPSNAKRGKGRAYIAGIYSEDLHRLYAAHYHALDPRPALLASLPVGMPVASHRYLDDAFVRGDEFHNEFLIPGGARYSISCDLIRETGLHADFCISRNTRQGPFEERDIERFAMFVPHLQNAARISATAAQWNDIGRFAVETLDRLSRGIVMVDGAGKVIYMNATAAQFLAREDGLLLRNNSLVAAKAAERTKLARQIAAVAGTGTGESLPDRVDLAISRTQHNVPYLVTLVPLVGEAFASEIKGELARAAALVTIVDPWLDNGTAHARLMTAFGLTNAEARLGAALLQGKSIGEIAQETGLGIPTLRTQLRAILRKTGTTRQAEFVRVGTMISALGVGRPPTPPNEEPTNLPLPSLAKLAGD